MMETEYRGYPIRYSENEDKWVCRDCGVTADTLSKAKADIDKLHLKLRKESAVECYQVMGTRDFTVQLLDTKLVEFIGMKPARSWDHHKGKVPMVAGMAKMPGKERPGRQEKNLYDLVPITDEVHRAVDAVNLMGQIAKAAKQEFDNALKELPRMEMEMIAGLVEASGHRFEEGD